LESSVETTMVQRVAPCNTPSYAKAAEDEGDLVVVEAGRAHVTLAREELEDDGDAETQQALHGQGLHAPMEVKSDETAAVVQIGRAHAASADKEVTGVGETGVVDHTVHAQGSRKLKKVVGEETAGAVVEGRCHAALRHEAVINEGTGNDSGDVCMDDGGQTTLVTCDVTMKSAADSGVAKSAPLRRSSRRRSGD